MEKGGKGTLGRRGPDAASLFLLRSVCYAFGDTRDAASLGETALLLDPGEAQRLQEDAAYHRLEPLLHHIVEDCRLLGHHLDLPPFLATEWARAAERERVRSVLVHHAARVALSALNRAGIRCIILKGVFLAERIYRRREARPFQDLDLMVRPGDLSTLNGILREAGFFPCPGRPSFVPPPASTVYLLPLEDGETVVEIDIHVGLHWPREYDRRTAFRAEALWEEALPESLEGEPCLRLCPAHLFLVTLLDLAVNHRFALLLKFRDLEEIAEREDVPWETMMEWASRWRVSSLVEQGLRLFAEIRRLSGKDAAEMEKICGRTPPPGITSRLLASILPAGALPRHRARSYSPANLLVFLLGDGRREKAMGWFYLPRHLYRGRKRF